MLASFFWISNKWYAMLASFFWVINRWSATWSAKNLEVIKNQRCLMLSIDVYDKTVLLFDSKHYLLWSFLARGKVITTAKW